MRESATQKLSKAYHLDEIACSVATMQSASALEEVAAHVLQRNPQDLDATYVHFFHEKIPSRQLAESTSLAPLNAIIASRPNDSEPLRTRALVRIFKNDLDGAVSDLKKAIDCNRPRSAHTVTKDVELYDKQQRNTRWQEDIILKEEEQPSSLGAQLFFQKAGVHLTIACNNVSAAFPACDHAGAPQRSEETVATGEKGEVPEMTQAEQEAQKKMVEARRLVRLHAKRALRDLLGFLSHFEYSPDLPLHIAEEYTHKATIMANGHRVPRNHAHSPQPGSPTTGPVPPHRVYKLSNLFAATPPSDLPPFPSTKPTPARLPLPQTTTEALTFHPLLADSLHSLLLCHCLIQTSAKELLRHAYMVARLSRLADGYPVFQASRSPARGDWVEIVRGANNWINLVGTWDDLCAPAPFPLYQAGSDGSGPQPVSFTKSLPSAKQAKMLRAAADDMTLDPSSKELVRSSSANSANAAIEAEKQRQDLIHHQAVLDSLTDERVTDESSFRLAILARKLRAERDYRVDQVAVTLDANLIRRELEGPPPADSDASPETTTEKWAAGAETIAKSSDPNSPTEATNGNSKTASTELVVIPSSSNSGASSRAPTPATSSRRSADDAAVRDYPIPTDRAMAVTRWILDAPPNAGVESNGDGQKRKKKRPASKTSGSASVAGVLGDILETGAGVQ